ncbi:di-heme oxidoredictase family protein [Bacteroides sp.]
MAKLKFYFTALAFLGLAACSDDPTPGGAGTGTGDELSEEWYAGGKLGTSFNSTSSAYEQSTPVVDASPTMTTSFLRGEGFFEDVFIGGTTPGAQRVGLGPLWIRNSCIACHPGYGHGRRQTRYRANDFGNGYLLVVTDETDTYLSSLTGMPQTKATAPFKAPIDETKITIDWLSYKDEWDNKFPDGESYELIYPEVTIPQSAYYVPLEVTKNGAAVEVPYENVRVRLESTIGIYGTGLLDAISDEDLKAQYVEAEKKSVNINPAIFANGEWTKQYSNALSPGEQHPLRFTYALSRGPVQDGPGANAIWNITNVTRSDRRYHYMTVTYAKVASQDPDVQKDFYTHFPEWNKTGNVETDIYNYLMNKELPVEMTDEDYTDLMVWHRGLAVPAARDLDDADVQRGKALFTEIGCATCHRPSWTTGSDEFTDPNKFFANADGRLPRYPYQKIWPYTDLMQHRLFMQNDIRTGWCRTTPLWGRGLSELCTGGSDRLHDCRARNVIEAIMWHGSAQSDARWTVNKFRILDKADRDAIVKFINAI